MPTTLEARLRIQNELDAIVNDLDRLQNRFPVTENLLAWTVFVAQMNAYLGMLTRKIEERAEA